MLSQVKTIRFKLSASVTKKTRECFLSFMYEYKFIEVEYSHRTFTNISCVEVLWKMFRKLWENIVKMRYLGIILKHGRW